MKIMTYIEKEKLYILLKDMEYFNIVSKSEKSSCKYLTKNAFYNRIFEYYFNNKINYEITKTKSKLKERVQFFVNKGILNQYNIESYSDEKNNFNQILYKYLENPRYEREKIVFFKTYELIKNAIKDEKILNLEYEYNSIKFLKIIPLFLKESREENAIYLVARDLNYKDKSREYRTFKLSRITNCIKTEISFNIKKYEKKIKKIKNNFDPNLNCMGKMIVKFTNDGLKKLEEKLVNRPKETKTSKNIREFYFSGSIEKYFEDFNDEMEIININKKNNKIIIKFTDKGLNMFYAKSNDRPIETKNSKNIKEFYLIPFMARIYFASFYENAIILDKEEAKNIMHKYRKGFEKNE
ncbi:WYL domain-containing protein [Oceanivirga salmonicida]|uniref:WYL domain-containing protein n=1 Tax=Oceanivirga salmonicida TaxID=1769291 RepID=UPI0012E2842E|nr:WYL domain-containing protein [Oceanivirga salmonicida]